MNSYQISKDKDLNNIKLVRIPLHYNNKAYHQCFNGQQLLNNLVKINNKHNKHNKFNNNIKFKILIHKISGKNGINKQLQNQTQQIYLEINKMQFKYNKLQYKMQNHNNKFNNKLLK